MGRFGAVWMLLRMAMQKEFRVFLLVVIILLGVGIVMGLAAAYPALTPFIYSLF